MSTVVSWQKVGKFWAVRKSSRPKKFSVKNAKIWGWKLGILGKFRGKNWTFEHP